MPGLWQGKVLQIAVFLVCIALTAGLCVSVWHSERETRSAQFEARAQRVRQLIENRFAQYEVTLRGVQGLFAGSSKVTHEEWDTYLRHINVSIRFPGLKGLGYFQRVTAAELPTHIAEMRGKGNPGYSLRPAGHRDEYLPLVYGAQDSQHALLGFDAWSEPARRETLAQARDSGEPRLTGPTHLLRDSDRADAPVAAVLMAALYRQDMPLTTPAQRRAALTGAVAGGFYVDELMAYLLGDEAAGLKLEIHDGDRLMYRSTDEAAATNALQRDVAMTIAGRTWHLQVAALPAFMAMTPSQVPLLAAAGALISLLIGLWVGSLRQSEERARALAGRMARKLGAAEQQFRLMINSVQDYGIFRLDAEGCVATWNRGAERIKGYSEREILGKHFAEFHTPEDRAANLPQRLLEQARTQGRSEHEGWRMRRNGERFWANVVLTALHDAEGVLVGFTKITRDLTERRQAEDRMRHIAEHDALTGLPNRVLLLDRLSQSIKRARRDSRSVAVLMLDLDHFKRINDSLGHEAGDRLLQQVAQRLVAGVRGDDTVARFGGDEFVVLLNEIDGASDARRITENLFTRLSEPYTVSGRELHVTPSVGICLYERDGTNAATLLRNADTALYHAKAQGRGNFQWFDRRLLMVAEEKLQLEGDLRQALKNGEFELNYQPLVTLPARRIVGMEALIRWRHPKHGLVMPDRFIPLAEETGLILPIGGWVLRQACVEAQRIREASGQALNIAVNVSTRQFQQDDFLTQVEDALAASGLPASALTLEITESVLAQDPQETIRLLGEIRDLGVSVAVDDFGTGYSSLSYVTRFPIAKLKIDRSFVSAIAHGASEAAVTSTIISMAHTLKLKVVAEGVENPQQMGFLSARACDEAQGYLFGPALRSEEFLKRLH